MALTHVDTDIDNLKINRFPSKEAYDQAVSGGYVGSTDLSLIEDTFDLDDLDDVTLTNPSTGQVLTYNSGTWVNAAGGGGGIQTLTSPVRIWDLDPGVYIIPTPCTIYYYGATYTSTWATAYGGGILNVWWQDSGNTTKSWFCLENEVQSASFATPPRTFLWGGTTSSSGYQQKTEVITQVNASSGRYVSTFLSLDAWTVANMSLNSILNSYCVGNSINNLTLYTTTTDLPSGVTLSGQTPAQVFTHNARSYQSASYDTGYVIRQDLYIPSLNKHFYRIIQYNYNSGSVSTPDTSIPNSDSNGWVSVDMPFPSITGNGGKILAVNSAGTGVQWVTNTGAGDSIEFAPYGWDTRSVLSTQTTGTGPGPIILGSGNQRSGVLIELDSNIASATQNLFIDCTEWAEHYIWVYNNSSVDVTIVLQDVTMPDGSSLSFPTGATIALIKPSSLSVDNGEVIEIGVLVEQNLTGSGDYDHLISITERSGLTFTQVDDNNNPYST